MSTEETSPESQNAPQETRAEDLTDELAKKYDPERLLKILARRAGRGESLDQSVRAKYEKRFGVDLGHVRIFSGQFAEEFNRQRDAYAVTIGATGMILMGNSPDKSLGSTSGQALLAHELTHVAQQAGGFHRKSTGGMPFAEEHEAEAEAVEHEVMHEAHAGAAAEGGVHADVPAESSAKVASADTMKKQIEIIKDRVLEMFGDAARNQYIRNGSVRRA